MKFNQDLPEVLDDIEEKNLPAGYTIKKNDELLIPYYMTNEDDFREIMTRESTYSFPAAAVGTVVAGPPGTAAGHIAGAIAGYVRHENVHSED